MKWFAKIIVLVATTEILGFKLKGNTKTNRKSFEFLPDGFDNGELIPFLNEQLLLRNFNKWKGESIPSKDVLEGIWLDEDEKRKLKKEAINKSYKCKYD